MNRIPPDFHFLVEWFNNRVRPDLSQIPEVFRYIFDDDTQSPEDPPMDEETASYFQFKLKYVHPLFLFHCSAEKLSLVKKINYKQIASFHNILKSNIKTNI